MSNELGGPVMFGVFRPIIVLPQVAEHWPVDRVRAAVLHESAHVRRGDAIVQLTVGLLCAAYWPNPLVRLAARRQRLDQERACDDRTIRAGMGSQAYARHLIDLARYGLAHRRLATALPAAGGELRQRIQAILDPRADRSTATPRKLAASTAGLLIAVASAAAIAVPVAERADAQAGPQEDPDIAALADADPAVRARGAWSLGERELPAAIPSLVERLSDQDASVRTMAAWALGEIKDRRAVDPLLAALRDDGDPFVREIAVLALGEIRDPRVAPALVAAFDDEQGVRAAAAWALRRLPRRARIQPAARLAASTEPWLDLDREPPPPAVRATAPLAVPEAVRLLGDADRATRAHAAWSLGIAADPSATDALIPRLRDEDATVRAVAVWALDEINPSHSRGSRR